MSFTQIQYLVVVHSDKEKEDDCRWLIFLIDNYKKIYNLNSSS